MAFLDDTQVPPARSRVEQLLLNAQGGGGSDSGSNNAEGVVAASSKLPYIEISYDYENYNDVGHDDIINMTGGKTQEEYKALEASFFAGTITDEDFLDSAEILTYSKLESVLDGADAIIVSVNGINTTFTVLAPVKWTMDENLTPVADIILERVDAGFYKSTDIYGLMLERIELTRGENDTISVGLTIFINEAPVNSKVRATSGVIVPFVLSTSE